MKAPRHWHLCGEFTGESPAQMASNTENVPIWWRHHEKILSWTCEIGWISRSNAAVCPDNFKYTKWNMISYIRKISPPTPDHQMSPPMLSPNAFMPFIITYGSKQWINQYHLFAFRDNALWQTVVDIQLTYRKMRFGMKNSHFVSQLRYFRYCVMVLLYAENLTFIMY